MTETETETIPSYNSITQTRRSTVVPRTHHVYRNRELSVEFSSYANSPSSIPLFHPLSVIEGTATITLAKGQTTPLEIRVTVQCGVEQTKIGYQADSGGSAYDRSRHKPFWSKEAILFPPNPEKSFKPILPEGANVFPFRFSIPKRAVPATVSKTLNFGTKEYDLPPTFVEAGFPYSIQYVVLVEVKYRFGKIDRTMPLIFRHLPVSKPGRSPSPYITAAYITSSPLPLPSADPDGYQPHQVTLNGSLFSQPFALSCQLFLPRPLAYTTSTRIHFFIQFPPLPGGEDTAVSSQVIDLLRLPRSTIAWLEKHAYVDGTAQGQYSETIAEATLWQRRDTSEGRCLQGEILVPPGTMTNFSFPCLEIGYRVNVEFKAPGVTITSIEPPSPRFHKQSPVVLSADVKLVNAFRDGDPRPPSYAPAPGYEDLPPSPTTPRSALTTVAERRGLNRAFW